ncbi:MAG: CheR family methyltransferase [Ferruginibacter sp.]|nr:CheR family methyltransferase [Ferruginibacter sp.]
MDSQPGNDLLHQPLSKSDNLFPVVGIGASAGGLDAFKKLVAAISVDSGMAYVLVQHLDPRHESHLAELLQKVTKVPVLEITDELRVKPNHIYIIPANRMLIENDGVLQLSPRTSSKHLRNMPIDLFFTSLAVVHQAHAIGVVLSGTATDGTLGLKAIKELGGITFAQDQNSAAYPSMPNSAIEADVVDFILSPELIPGKLLEIKNTGNKSDQELSDISIEDADTYQHMLTLLKTRKGTDFTYYKQTTIRRRIMRRMTLNKQKDLSDYLFHLSANVEEQDALYKDILIPVTSFFRDKEVFDALSKFYLPQLLKSKALDEIVRVWVPSCSTGEEAYSIAICLKELLKGKSGKFQMFATDINANALSKARTGIYTKAELDGVEPARLKRFFTEIKGGYQIAKEIRDMCVFALHNFVKDPPFGKMDLVSCRNVLIYMEAYLQKKALTTFHYALVRNGTLLLGKSETTASMPDLFASTKRKPKLFVRKDVQVKFMHVASQRIEKTLQDLYKGLKSEPLLTDFEKTADQVVLSRYAPPGVVVNHAMDIVQFRGNTGNYLQQVSGKPSHNIFKMAKDGLAFKLRNILLKARKENQAVTKENIPFLLNGSPRLITIEVIPLPNIVDPHYLVSFIEQLSSPGTSIKALEVSGGIEDLYTQSIETELAQSREEMRIITEDHEAANEELQGANEELLSGSEELQSLNEELETSKEELQSTNEELISVNERVTYARHYAELIVSTIREPLLILDKNLRVKGANDAFCTAFKLRSEEIEGVLVYDLGNKQWDIPELRHLLETIIPQKAAFNDFEVSVGFPALGERVILLNARKMTNEKISEKLILLAFEDITTRREAERLLEASELFNRSILESSPDCIKVLDARGKLQYMNSNGTCLLEIDDFGLVKDQYWWDMWGKEQRSMIKAAVSKALAGEKVQFQAFRPTRKGKPKWWDVIVLPVQEPGSINQVKRILSVSRDITLQVNAQDNERELLNRFHDIVAQVSVGILILRGTNLVVEIANETFLTYAGKKEKDIIGQSLFASFPGIRSILRPHLLSVLATGQPYIRNEIEVSLVRLGSLGTYFFNCLCKPLVEDGNKVTGIVCVVNDVTEVVMTRKRLEAQALMVENLLMTAPGFISTLRGPDHVYQLVNDQYQQLFGNRQIQGLPIMQALPELKGQGFDLILDEVYATGTPYVGNEIPISLSRDLGLQPELRYFNFSYQPMYDENKKVYSILVFGYEVTEQVNAKNKNIEDHVLREKNLDEKVQQRTHQLSVANELLYTKNEELLRLNQELQAFTFISSHDLQEPLRKITTFSKLIIDREAQNLSSKGKNYFERIQASTTRMQTLIQDLLLYSQTNISERIFERTNLAKMLDEVKEDLSELITQKTVLIEASGLGEIMVIPFQFRQLFNNLISNSIKFSKTAVPCRIIISGETADGHAFNEHIAAFSTQRLSPSQHYCHLAFSDNGIGFEPRFQEKIFGLFQRLHDREDYPGTGIGLSIVKKIVENHNGLVIGTSEFEKGATFDIYIPLVSL